MTATIFRCAPGVGHHFVLWHYTRPIDDDPLTPDTGWYYHAVAAADMRYFPDVGPIRDRDSAVLDAAEQLCILDSPGRPEQWREEPLPRWAPAPTYPTLA